MDRIYFTGLNHHFVIKHQEYLEKKMINTDLVLHSLLQQDLITKDQYDHILSKASDQQRMMELYQHVRLWKTKEQDKLYMVFRQENYTIIRDMEMAEKRLPHGFKPLSPDTEAFLRTQQQQLIEQVVLVDPVLDDLLDQDVLLKKQYDYIGSHHSLKEKMKELLDIANDWGDYAKYLLYQALLKYNSFVIRGLERPVKKNKKKRTNLPKLLSSSYEPDQQETNSRPSRSFVSVSPNKLSPTTKEYSEAPRMPFSLDIEEQDKEWVLVRLAITCSICTDIFADPVTLTCGHNFCLGCITRTWNEQFEGEASCPHCRQRFKRKPDLKKNLTLSQIAECYQTSQSDGGATSHGCTYCTHANVPPVRACLTCQSLLCNDHLNVHCGAPVLLDPTASLHNRKCPIHNKILEYYCIEDSLSVCASCCIFGEHKGHRVELLTDASVKKKEKLRNFQGELILKLSLLSANIQDLMDCRREIQDGFCETQFYLIPTNNEDKSNQHWPPHGDSALVKVDLQYLSSLVQEMEMKHHEMSAKVKHIGDVCNMTDALMVIQEPRSEGADFYTTTFSYNVDPFHHHIHILKKSSD